MQERIQSLVVPETSGRAPTPRITLKSLGERLNLTLESPKDHHGLRKSIEEQKRRELFTRAQQGDFRAIYQLLSPFGPLVDAQTQQLVPEVRRGVIAELAGKVLKNLPNIEWQGSTKFAEWLYITIRNTKVDQRRKESRNAKKRTEISENPNHNLNDPPRDLFNLWIEKHPDRYRELISSLTERQRLIFEGATMGHLSMKQIKAHSGAASINAVKVTLNRVRVNLAEKAGIHLPKSYQPIRHFADRGVSRNLIRDWVAAGKVKGALRFLGMYYLTEQIFERHFGEKTVI